MSKQYLIFKDTYTNKVYYCDTKYIDDFYWHDRYKLFRHAVNMKTIKSKNIEKCPDSIIHIISRNCYRCQKYNICYGYDSNCKRTKDDDLIFKRFVRKKKFL